MAALLERERSGRGQWVHTSLLEAMIAMLDFQATRWLIAGEVPPQAGNDHPTGFPTGVFPTSDGFVNVGTAGERTVRDFLKVLGLEELGDDPRFATGKARGANREEMRRLIEPKTRQMTTDEVVERMNAAGVPCGPIYSIDQVFADPQVQHLEMAQKVPSEVYGELTLVRAPVRLSRTSSALRRGAPAAGAHTAEVLAELGLTPEEITQLEVQGAVGLKQTVGAR
jgi:crotonobetainyl-CoA:carnitine CoA-transferase CaiB-like acyl-CoA transferase